MFPRGESWRGLKLPCLAGAGGALLGEDRQGICSALRYYCNRLCAERFVIPRNKDEQICPRFINGSRIPTETGREGRVGEILLTAWLDSYTLPGCCCYYQGELWGKKVNPKMLFERHWDSSRRKENFKVGAGF